MTKVAHFVVLFFEFGSELASLTTAVSVIVVFALAVTFTVICTRAPVGFFFVHAAKVGMLQEPATLPQEVVGDVMEQIG